MGKESGKKVILKIGDGEDPEVFTAMAGQKDARFNGQSSPVDVGDKTSNNWGATIGGTNNATVTCSGVANWPDLTGLAAVRTAWKTGANINCELIMNADGDKWKGAFSVTGFEEGGADNGATEYSITLQNAGELTWTEAP